MHTIHIMPLCGLWYVRSEGGHGLLDFNTRDEALRKCEELMGSRPGCIAIHNADGSVVEELKVGTGLQS